MLPVDQTIEEEKLAFFQELQTQYPSIDIENISIASSKIEQLIEYKILDRALSNIGRILGDSHLHADGLFFNLHGHTFEMSVTEDVKNRGTLLCSCMCRSVDKQPRPPQLEFPLESPSRYKRVVFIPPPSVASIDDVFLQSLFAGIFDVAYNWLSHSIRIAVSRATAEVTDGLYQFVRVMLPSDPKLLEGFLFSVLIKDKGASKPEDVVILDDMAVELAMKLASRTAASIGRNPADIAMEVTTEIVPTEDSVIPDVCKDGNPVDINLKSEKYYQASMSFNLAMQAVWGPTVTCFPIITDGQLRLVAFYKTEYKGIITPFLTVHKTQLQERAKATTHHIKKSFDILRRIKKPTGTDWGIWAELLGRFAGGFERAAH